MHSAPAFFFFFAGPLCVKVAFTRAMTQKGWLIPPDRWMFVLECLLCLIRTGGGKQITGRPDASTESLISFFLCCPLEVNKKNPKKLISYFRPGVALLPSLKETGRSCGRRPRDAGGKRSESKAKSDVMIHTRQSIKCCCPAEERRANHSSNCPSSKLWQYPARHIDHI